MYYLHIIFFKYIPRERAFVYIDEIANSENIEFHYMSRHERVWLTTATRAQCLTLVKRGCVSQFL